MSDVAKLMERNAELAALLKESKVQLQVARAEMVATDDLSARQHALQIAAWWCKPNGKQAGDIGKVMRTARQFYAWLTEASRPPVDPSAP